MVTRTRGAGTVSGNTTGKRSRVSPVVIHVASYDDLLRPPMGLFPLEEKLVVGRAQGEPSEPGIWLEDERVSSKHLAINRTGGGIAATDLGSSNGTFVNGVSIDGPTLLSDGDLIECGRSLLCFRILTTSAQSTGWVWGSGRTFNQALGKLGVQLDRIARSSEPVLLLGETGTGKEIAARRVHTISERQGPLVAVDCGALPENLVESTLFGHEKGAFTGATEARMGEITRAHQGTLFLDEVGNLPLTTQAKLLRVLETKLVRSVGGRDPQKVDVRFIAATNSTLDEATFREDLRFRLAGFVATIPPLRERREDLGLLSCALLAELGIRKARISRSAAKLLFHHPLPGNVRQLRQALRTAALLHPDALEVDLDAEAFESLEASSKTKTQEAVESKLALRGEPPPRETLEGALTKARGNVAAAAREFKTSARQLYRWLERHQLDPDAFRGR